MTDAVRIYESESCQYKVLVTVDADLPELTEEQRDVIAAKMQATFDRLLLKALYGDPESIAQSKNGENT